MIDQKQLENVDAFKYLGSILTNDGSGTRHVNKERRHNLNTHVHTGTTPIIRLLATSKIRHIVLPEDGPIGLKHVGEK